MSLGECMDADAVPGDQDQGRRLRKRRRSSIHGQSDAENGQSPVIDQSRRPGSGRVGLSYPRKRAVTACQVCRARKTKCDNQRPVCGFCSSLDLDCHFEARKDHSSFDPASLEILEGLNRIIEAQGSVLNVVQAIQKLVVPPEPERRNSASWPPPTPATDPGSLQSLHEAAAESEFASEQLYSPPAHTIPDSILNWPVFGTRYCSESLQAALLASAPSCDTEQVHTSSGMTRPKARFKYGFQEDEVHGLIQRFIDLVHTKNPILDEAMLKRAASRVVEDGLMWDSTSCLVLLTCALGAIATPFQHAYRQMMMDPLEYGGLPSLLDRASQEKAEAYFALAQRRIGLLDESMLACQCHFISGVYLMYTFRPIKAFQSFHQASITYQIYSKSADASAAVVRDKRLEQRLFWSCFKSECELLSEIDLPQSGVAHQDYINTFPQPPDTDDADRELDAAGSPDTFDTIRREQQQSWFYYLSEIALRRIGNRVLNYFYKHDHGIWAKSNMRPMLQAANEFLRQLEEWYECLPSPVRYSEECASHIPDEELPYMLRTRVLEIKSWIYRPFLFRAIHCSADSRQRVELQAWADTAIQCCVQLIQANSLRHRHHGTWYTLRLSAASAISICAAAMRGLAPDAWALTVRLAIETLLYWETECTAEIRKARLILDELVADLSGAAPATPA